MSAAKLTAVPLTAEEFTPFGDVIEARGQPDRLINEGRCGRFHDLAKLDFRDRGRAGISLFHSQPISLPFQLQLVERHPMGSQCFIPMTDCNYLVVVGEDKHGKPTNLRAFFARSDQGVNYHRNTWHGVLMPIHRQATFAVVDWIGSASNLEEHHLQLPIEITETNEMP